MIDFFSIGGLLSIVVSVSVADDFCAEGAEGCPFLDGECFI